MLEYNIASEEIKNEFEILGSASSPATDRLLYREEYKTLNRYIDILPFKNTCVILKDWKFPENYINACYVDSVLRDNDKRFIATQGPLPETLDHFFDMIK